ncbi:glycosyltransferase family 25 protein [Ophiocordyceps sinensis CO18]|uniref:Glycosyltransferase family 25 protein n=1 Tax=Ophiocordyceps sinensis (strain Co18 / CGMCC 3.14243) TaxID=911162 RepID=T5AIX3_OPHSC|nr:glycosyltransferase family 25 protein [Ophiocordyceps sinensis CO18]
MQAGFPKRLVLAVGGVVVFLTILVLRHDPHAPRQTTILEEINNTTLGFEKIFVVGLPSRTDRRDGMALQAALSNLEIDFVDGVKDSNVAEKAIPKAENVEHVRGPSLGSWRGHLNAIQHIVRQNLSSALILEDDVDWDVRLRGQLRDFALATHALVQPLRAGRGRFADATFPGRADGAPSPALELDSEQLPATVPPTTSPYGDGWDVLWIGHCGMHFPFDNGPVPRGRVIHRDDVTVPRREHLWTFNIPFTLPLRRQSLRRPQGATPHCSARAPGLFHHHRTVGPEKEASDIGNHGDGFRTRAGTDMVRFSTRLNADVLLAGGTAYTDQFPD